MASSGTCKSFNAVKGFGFITMADGSDIFCHIKACTDGGVPKQGDVLSFTMEPSQSKPGQMAAANVTGGTGVDAKNAPATGTMQGTVKSFNPEKNFGFITGPDGNDVFIHGNSCVDGSTPQAGDTITFDVEPSRSNPEKMQCVNATGGTGFGGGKGGGKGGGWGMDAWGGGGWGGGGCGAMKGGWGGGKGGPYGGGKGGWGGGW